MSKFRNAVTCANVPNADFTVEAPGRNPFPIGRKGNGSDGIGVLQTFRQLFAVWQAPEAYGEIPLAGPTC